MQIIVLGTGANGGIPQWDCCCPNCTRARSNNDLTRTRSSVAVTLNERNHLLIDAGPDLKQQLEVQGIVPTPEEAGPTNRQSRISAVLLTHGHGDHTVGIAEFSTGKSFSIPVYASKDLLSFMFGSEEHLNFFGALGRLAKNYVIPVAIHDGEVFEPLSGVHVESFEVDHTDRMPDRSMYPSSSHCFEIESNGKRFLYLSDLGKLTDPLVKRIARCELTMLDATFWWNDELTRLSGLQKTSYDLGHVPVQEIIRILKGLESKVLLTHINHTNPLADPQSEQARILKESGIGLAYDGMRIKL